jgi:hypothetical protein
MKASEVSEWVALDCGFPVGSGRSCDEAMDDATSSGFTVTSVVRRLRDYPHTHLFGFDLDRPANPRGEVS